MKYLYEKEEIIHAKCEICGKILKFKNYELNEIQSGVECFCGNVSNQILGIPTKKKQNDEVVVKNTQPSVSPRIQPVSQNHAPISNVPRCPTCGSLNVEKISMTSKAVGGVMFGVFSSNIRNTFKCKKCGYKW